MPLSQHAINRQVLCEIRHDLLGARRVPPIPHQIADDRKQRHKLHARGLHARIRRVAQQRRRGARALDVCEHGVALGAQRERHEGRAHIGDDARDDYLRLVGCFDGGAEVGVVPCAEGLVSGDVARRVIGLGLVGLLDFALAADERGVGIQVQYSFREGAVRALFSRRGHDDGEIEEFAQLGVRHDVVVVDRVVEVADELVQAHLVVDDEKDLGFC
jgi:hypothetical protein